MCMRLFKVNFLLLSFLLPVQSFAGDISWSGVYRFEANSIINSELDGDKNYQKDYGLHHLVLMPKMVLSDGIYLKGRMHLFNNNSAGNQLGSVWGGGANNGTVNSSYDSNASSDRVNPQTLNISELYANFNHQFGQFIVGRVPIDFGLGITYNNGHGLFDHWYDNRDMVAYKFYYGNLSARIGYAKMVESTINANADDVNELSLHVQYENQEAEFEAGAYYQLRTASARANDIATKTATTPGFGTDGSTNDRELETKDFNIYMKRQRQNYSFGFEGAFHKGALGVTDNDTGAGITRDAFAFAGEYEYHPMDSSYALGAKVGMATGDDPATKGDFEGFWFDRNYDVATLLFNHALGQDNFLGTAPNGGGGSADNKGYDVEQISNVIYLAPYYRKNIGSNWTGQLRFATGFLQQKVVSGSGSDLGYEIDLSFTYSPYERFQWVNEFAYLLPGDAFKAGGTYKADDAMAFISKVAISF